MAEYIERDRIIKNSMLHTWKKADLLRAVKEAPTADVVEVVRCKGCKRWGGKYNDYGLCHFLCRQTAKNDFCSYGEAKMDGKGGADNGV